MIERRLAKFLQLTRSEYFADFFITPPITLFGAYYSLTSEASLAWPFLFFAGAFAWTLYEYAIHRYVLHEMPVFRMAHGLHHNKQRDYIGTPPWATVATYVLFYWLFGAGIGGAFAVGFSAGYVCYSAMHTAFHYLTIRPGDWFYAAKMRHVIHHRFDTLNYGVTTSLWDRLFKTNRTI